MKKETYQDAVLKSVMWWSEKAFATPANQNNGDDSENGGMTFMLMNLVASKAQKEVSTEQIKKFEEKLSEILLEAEGKGKFHNELSVDYHPNQALAEACEYAGVNPMCLPCKTFTYIDKDNVVNGRYQYGGEWFKL